jgi:hypothetical protein
MAVVAVRVRMVDVAVVVAVFGVVTVGVVVHPVRRSILRGLGTARTARHA